MNGIISFLRELDTKVQKKFDWFIFFLMRHFGWTKATIRYAIWAITILAVMITIGCDYISENHKWSIRATANIILLGLLIFIQWDEYRASRATEEIGAGNCTDYYRVTRVPFKVAFACVLVLCTLQFIVAWFFPGLINSKPELISNTRADTTANLVLSMAYLAIFYLAKTPPKAPQIKDKQTVLVPARQHQS